MRDEDVMDPSDFKILYTRGFHPDPAINRRRLSRDQCRHEELLCKYNLSLHVKNSYIRFVLVSRCPKFRLIVAVSNDFVG